MPRFGWIPDLPDSRDRLYSAPQSVLAALPPQADLRGHLPPVFDQGDLGSCTANAAGNAHRYAQMRQGSVGHFATSRLFVYYNTRELEGTIQSDAGATLRNTVKSIAQNGVCPEADWPYMTSQFRTRPPQSAYVTAENHQAVRYQRITRSLDQLKACLADGYPFVFGFTIYDSFMAQPVTTTGRMPLPKPWERSQGGHAVLAVGYDDAEQVVIVQNSWGERWGDRGFFYMPYAFIVSQNANDFWRIDEVEVETPPEPDVDPPQNDIVTLAERIKADAETIIRTARNQIPGDAI